jgi:alpha-methylacyl-CoA racemase
VGEDGHVNMHKAVLNQAPHFCESYVCKPDPKKPSTRQYMAVQAIEPQFYKQLLKGLGMDKLDGLPGQMDQSAWPWMKTRLGSIFKTKTRDEWADIFYDTDACAVPVLNAQEAALHPHNVARGSFAPTPGAPGVFEPSPAPKLSRTPGYAPRPNPTPGGDTRAVLSEFGFGEQEVQALFKTQAAVDAATKSRL